METTKTDVSKCKETCVFIFLVLMVQVLGIASIVLVVFWLGHFRNGFGWQVDPEHKFNFHPVFMVSSFIYLYSDAILVYRVFRNVKKLYIKVLHTIIQVAVLGLAVVGLQAVFEHHNEKGIPHMRSLHSWVGMATVALFGLQWLVSLITFMFPCTGQSMKSTYLSHHVFWGVAILGMAVISVHTGITEKSRFRKRNGNHFNKTTEEILLNSLGICIMAVVVLSVYLVTNTKYKRQPSPYEYVRL